MRTKTTIAFASIAIVVAVSAQARDKRIATPQGSMKPGCERGTYVGDPVCDVGTDGPSALPTPRDRQGNRGREGGVAVTDELRLKGRSDFNDNRYGGTQFYNPNFNPSPLQGVNGGGGLDYKF